MNRLTIIGNLTRDPESNNTQNGKTVCNFTVAVNRRRQQNPQEPEADFFRVAAWGAVGENCQKFLAKGRKVCVIGPVSVRTYTGNDGTTRASMEVFAQDVEFLSPRQDGQSAPAQQDAAPSAQQGFTPVENEELPF